MNIPIRTTHFLLHKFSIHQVCFCLYVVFTSNESFKWGFPGGSAGKESACNAGDLGPIPGLGRFPWRRERPGKGKEGTSHYGSQNPNINDTLDQIWTKEIAAGRPHCTGHPTPNNPPNCNSRDSINEARHMKSAEMKFEYRLTCILATS